MTEIEKMRSGELADMSAPELQVRFEHAKKLLARMRCLSTYDETYRGLLEELIPDLPATSVICPPFHCDHTTVTYRHAGTNDSPATNPTVFANSYRISVLFGVTAFQIVHWMMWSIDLHTRTYQCMTSGYFRYLPAFSL